METKPWVEIENRVHDMCFEESFDMIVAIANGGIIPAAIIQQKLKIPVELLKISFRDASHKPLYNAPQLVAPLHFDVKGKNILLVEDRVKTGATLGYAKQLLKDAAVVKTLAVNGPADYSLFNENCFSFPWIFQTRI